MNDVRFGARCAASLLVALLAGCVKQESPDALPKMDLSRATGVFSPALPGVPSGLNEPVVVVNDQVVTRGQLLMEVQKLVMGMGISSEQAQANKDRLVAQAIDSIVSRMLLLQAGYDQTVEVTDVEIQDRLDQLAANLPEGATLGDAARQQGLDEDALRQAVKDGLMMNKMMDRATREVAPPSEEEIQAFYQENKTRFVNPERLESLVIFRQFEAQTNAEDRQQIEEEMEILRKRIQDGQTTFEETAAIHSDHKAPDGSHRMVIPRGQMPKPFETFIFNLQPGVVSEVAITESGAWLFQPIQRLDSEQVALEDARETILNTLVQSRKQEALREYLKQLRAKATIEVKTQEAAPAAPPTPGS